MSRIPVEVPTGAIRYNTDSNKMECFNGTKWWQISVSESAPIGGRGIQFGAGANPRDEIQYFNLTTRGDALDFGNLNAGRSSTCAVSSATRGFCCGGYYAPGEQNEIQEIIIATLGNAIDFGDLNNAVGGMTNVASRIRVVFAGGRTPSEINNMDYVQIPTTGNAVDFGDLLTTVSNAASVSNGHGGLG